MFDRNAEWANSMVATLPRPWASHILSRWENRRSRFNPLVTTAEGTAQRIANEELRTSVGMMRPVSENLPLDASDNEVCNHAWAMAERCRVELLALVAVQKKAPTDGFIDTCHAAGVCCNADALDAYEQRLTLARLVVDAGIKAPEETQYDDVPAVRRMIATHWWKGRLRKAHGKAREAAAIRLGIVGRGRECYVSTVSREDRRYQNERNAAALEATIAKNLETEQEFTLAQLAAKGTANKEIRRAELMTRINGFERIAIAGGHAGLFLTLTCPSQMHRKTTVGAGKGKCRSNGEWDGTLPDQAQAHLSEVWARIRAALARRGVRLYGFRIAEPNHDGTPHWHFLIFHETLWPGDAVRMAQPRIAAIMRRYALHIPGAVLPKLKVLKERLRRRGWSAQRSSKVARKLVSRAAVRMRAAENAQPGAKQKRLDIKRMDPAKGTAAGYIAKYVAKNIDGYRLEKDLEGNDSLETSARVEAWASRWRIRQFQQVGGPPVTVWRELRRVESVPADAPSFVLAAHNAVNKIAVFEGRENASVAWDHYVKAQGGVHCGRNYRVRIATMQNDKPGRYGEVGADSIVGIQYVEKHAFREYREAAEDIEITGFKFVRARTVTVESKRFTWEIKRPNANTFTSVRGASSILSYAGGAERVMPRLADDIVTPDGWLKGAEQDAWKKANPGAAREWELGLKRAQRAPWTCVNNCTDSADDIAELNESTYPVDRETIGRHERKAGGGSLREDRRPK